MVRALASHQCGLGSNRSINTMIKWVEFVVGFLKVLQFSPPSKPTLPNSNSTRDQVEEEGEEEPLCGCATSKSY